MAPRSTVGTAVGAAAFAATAACGSAFVSGFHGAGHAAEKSSVVASGIAAQGSAGSIPPASSSTVGVATMAGALVVVAGHSAKRSAKMPVKEVAMKFSGGDAVAAPKAFDPATELGVQDPIGFWDPLGYCEDKDEATFKRRRAVEIKHGRISMYATIGYIVPEYFRFPGYLSPSAGIKFSDMPNGLAALSKLPALGGAQIVAFAGLIETTGFFSGSTTDGRGSRGLGQMKDSTEGAEPGNYGVGFPTFIGTVADPEERKTKLAAELANGRLAMMAIIGMFFQDGLTGSAWGDWSLYTASPLRSVAMKFSGGDSVPAPKTFDPATELGVQDPVGFWDPLGFCEDKDEATFKRRRAVEIKHGRISMYATMGYIVPEYFRFPGYLSPSAGIKFSDMPNGLAALSKLPALGGAQIIAFAGLIETTGFFSGSTTDGRGPRGLGQMKDSTEGAEPGNYGVGFPTFIGTVADPEERKTKLAAELANGRLAMMAIIGMFFQDGLTGSAWGDWSLYTASPLRSVSMKFSGGDSVAAPKTFDPAMELGVQDPVGFWDPLGYCEDKDEATFKRRRAVEIKHGRISMYATMGYIVPEYFRFPGYLSPSAGIKFSDMPNGLAALSKLPALGGAQIVAFAGLIETTGFFSGSTTDGRGPRGLGQMKDSTEGAEPGNYGVGFPTFIGTVADPEERKTKLAAELANGRLAMMAIIGMFFQDGLTGSAWGDWSLYTASPLRAEAADEATPPPPPPFEPAQQIGALAPLGYFDPAGFSKTGDEAGFRNLRVAELKHGRVAMMAALGGVVQHYVKFPAFESVPAGLGAVTTAPGTYGFVALFLLSGAMELAVWTQDPNKEVGDFGDPLGLGQYDTDMRNKELNNGRFAMFAALGIVSADLLTGKDAIQQFGL